MIDIAHHLYQVIPTPIYKQLSNQYHRYLQYSAYIRTHENFDFENIYFAFVIGVSLGIVLVTFLEYFPGECCSYVG